MQIVELGEWGGIENVKRVNLNQRRDRRLRIEEDEMNVGVYDLMLFHEVGTIFFFLENVGKMIDVGVPTF